MKVERVKIATLMPDPANARRHPERNLQAIKASLTRFGQQRPILVDSKNVVVAGNGTLEAASALGWTEIDIIRTGLTATDATAYAIADNRTSELAEWDRSTLVDLLGTMESELDTVGFQPDEVEAMRRILEAERVAVTDPANEWENLPEFSNPGVGTPSVTIHFPTDEDADRFFAMIERPRARYLWWPNSDGFVGSSRSEALAMAPASGDE